MRIKEIGITLVVGGLFIFGAGAIRAAQEQQRYPTKPIRVVAPFPPGGTADFLARVLAEKLTQTWGQQVIVDNRSGAGGVIGTDIVAKSTPDGYTLLMSAIGHAANPTLYRKLPYDTLRDFAPIALIADVPLIVVVNPGLGASSVTELIAHARGKPGQLNFAAGGVGASYTGRENCSAVRPESNGTRCITRAAVQRCSPY